MDFLFLINKSKVRNFGKKDYLPLWEAMREGHVEIVEIFIGLGANPDRKGRGKKLSKYTFLQYAAKGKYSKNNYKIAEVLVRHGAKMDESLTKNRRSALDLAIIAGNIKLVELFLENGASIERDFESIADVAYFNEDDSVIKEMLVLLHKYGMDLNYHNELSENLLHMYLSHYECREKEGDPALVAEQLLDFGIPVDELDENGDSPLHRIITPMREYRYGSDVEVASLLIKRGADVNLVGGSFKKNPLITAVTNQYEAMVELLLENGADIEAREDSRGFTALHVACLCYEHNDREILKLLMRKGADVNAKDNEGRKPFDLIKLRIMNGNLEMF